MDYSKYKHLNSNIINKILFLVNSGKILGISTPKTNNPIIVEENQLIRDYLDFRANSIAQ